MMEKAVSRLSDSAFLSIIYISAYNSAGMKAHFYVSVIQLILPKPQLPGLCLVFYNLETYKVQGNQNFVQGIFLTIAVKIDIYENSLVLKVVFPVLKFQVLFLTLWSSFNGTIISLWSIVTVKTVAILMSSFMGDIFKPFPLMYHNPVSLCCYWFLNSPKQLSFT